MTVNWETVYAALKSALISFGKDDAFGDGDYWLIDDEWGGQFQKLCVTSCELDSSDLIRALQHCLLMFADWGVIVVFEDGSGRRPFSVFSDRVVDECPNLD
jgi:hypothetical protein